MNVKRKYILYIKRKSGKQSSSIKLWSIQKKKSQLDLKLNFVYIYCVFMGHWSFQICVKFIKTLNQNRVAKHLLQINKWYFVWEGCQ